MIGYYILIGAIALVSWLVSNQLKQKFAKYSKVQLRNGMSGKEIAEKMLADNGIYDVEVISTPGQLTDHYNPKNKTVNLSEAVYNQRNAAAAAVAAAEAAAVSLRRTPGFLRRALRSFGGDGSIAPDRIVMVDVPMVGNDFPFRVKPSRNRWRIVTSSHVSLNKGDMLVRRRVCTGCECVALLTHVVSPVRHQREKHERDGSREPECGLDTQDPCHSCRGAQGSITQAKTLS